MTPHFIGSRLGAGESPNLNAPALLTCPFNPYPHIVPDLCTFVSDLLVFKSFDSWDVLCAIESQKLMFSVCVKFSHNRMFQTKLPSNEEI